MTAHAELQASLGIVADLLNEARARTLLLVSPLTEDDLRVQHDILMSPVIWDLGHIAHFEDVWLIQNVETGGTGSEGLSGIFDPFSNPRSTRANLPLPTIEDCLNLLASVRARTLAKLTEVSFDTDAPLLRDGYVYQMVLQHEYQHNETILQTLQLKRGEPYRAPRLRNLPPGQPIDAESACDPYGNMVRFPGGVVELGTDDRSVAYDNERPRHRAKIRPFWIDQAPVTNAQYLRFMESSGYRRREFWSDAGWEFITREHLESPKYWYQEGGEWHTRSMDQSGRVIPDQPVCHVCFHEAEAFARHAGKRLPTEGEWEAAASWDPASGAMRMYPWGNEPVTAALANVDQLTFAVAPIGAYSGNISPIGCYGMIGDVWEWTSSDFVGYPAFRTFPYKEYSEVFFGPEYKVLRGGSWATRSGAIRNTFRNWDYPIRRQIFSGFRCARDA
ncbi:MAG: ergothioneine biosynthesis protein EgtB [Gemmatimonadota bacterium]